MPAQGGTPSYVFHQGTTFAQGLYIDYAIHFAGVMYHAVTQQQGEDSRIINFVTMGDDFFMQRQVEKRSGMVFMRAKRRRV
jgi:hypothetical protein